jgi:hypothetical protein
LTFFAFDVIPAEAGIQTYGSEFYHRLPHLNKGHGTMFSTLVNLTLPAEASNAIWKIVQAAFQKILLITG